MAASSKLRWSAGVLGILILMGGCGVISDTTKPAPDISALLETAWNLYDSGEFDSAAAVFDSVLVLDNLNQEAYIGAGWTEIQRGFVDRAHSFFSLCVSASGVEGNHAAVGEVVDLETAVDTITRFGMQVTYILPQHTPVVGVEAVKIGFATADIFYFTPDTIFIRDTLQPEDTLVTISYFYLSGDALPDWVKWAYLGDAGAFMAEEAYSEAVTALNTFLLKEAVDFLHYPYTTVSQAQAGLALAYFKLGYYKNVVDVLKVLDPDWTPPDNPYDPDSFWTLLRKIETLLAGG